MIADIRGLQYSVLAAVGSGPCVKSGEKLKVACAELNVFSINTMP